MGFFHHLRETIPFILQEKGNRAEKKKAQYSKVYTNKVHMYNRCTHWIKRHRDWKTNPSNL